MNIGKASYWSFFRLFFGVLCVVYAVIEYIVNRPMSEMTVGEFGDFMLPFVVGMYFLLSGRVADLDDRVKNLEAGKGK